MEYIHAALLLHSAGKKISAASITKVVKAAGMTNVDDARIKSLVAAIEEVDIEEAIKATPSFAAPAAAPTAAVSSTPSEAKEETKEEKKEDEEDLGLASLFG